MLAKPLTDVASQSRAASAGRSAWLRWASATVVFAAFAVVALVNMQSGLHGDARTVNPDPTEVPYPPCLGVQNWPLVTSVSSVLITIGFFAVVIRWSIRDRRLHWALMAGTAALWAGALDPLANWATFTVSDSRVAHFPLSWPYFNASPLLEPTLSFLGGYASYYALTGIGLLGFHRRFVEPRLSAAAGSAATTSPPSSSRVSSSGCR